jgi:hypothetical protein
VVLVFIHHRELKIAVERRARYGLPHKSFIERGLPSSFDLNHRKRRNTPPNFEFDSDQTAFSDRHKLQVRGPHDWRPMWNGSSGARTLSTTAAFWNA